MTTKEKICDHEIGRKAIGGFSGHPQVHPTGNQYCFKCGEYLNEIFDQIRQETEKAFGGCKNCYGKGWASVIEYALGAEDFGGDGIPKYKLPEIRFCSCERGKELRKRFDQIRQEARKETISYQMVADEVRKETIDDCLKALPEKDSYKCHCGCNFGDACLCKEERRGFNSCLKIIKEARLFTDPNKMEEN